MVAAMKRGKPLARKTPLRQGDKTLKRGGSLTQGTRKRKVTVPPRARAEALARCDGRCVVCHRRGRLQRHHVLDEQLFPEHARESLNLVMACIPDHERHTLAFRRIRRDELPAEVLAWALALPDPALAWFESRYPA